MARVVITVFQAWGSVFSVRSRRVINLVEKSIERKKQSLSDTPYITVCTPVYNQEKYIAETLQSVVDQTFDDFEVIIVNDGSHDATEEIVKPFLSDKRFRYIYQQNAGVGAARNTAMNNARGKWFCQLDGDDLFVPTALETFARLSKKDSNANFVYANMEMFFGDNKRRISLTEDFFAQGDIKSVIYSKYGFPTTSVMMRIDSLRAIGGYRTHFPALEDYDLYMRFAQNGIHGVSENTVVALYRVLSGTKTGNLVRASKLCAGMVEEIISNETDKSMIPILEKTYNFHMSRFNLMSAIQIGTSDKKKLLSHLVQSVKYRPRRQKRAILSIVLTAIAILTHTSIFDETITKLVRSAQEMPWADLD